MIENDPKQSIAYFRTPVQAGAASRAMPLEWLQIFGLLLIAAIIYVAGLFLFIKVAGSDFLYGTLPPDAPIEMQQVYTIFKVFLLELIDNPLMTVLSNLIATSLLCYFAVMIARMFQNPISYREGMSALARFEIVRAFVIAVSFLICAFAFSISPAFGLTLYSLNSLLLLALVIIMFFVWKGIFGFRSAFASFGLALASFACLTGLARLIALLFGV